MLSNLAHFRQTSGRPLADLRPTSGRPLAGTFTSNIPPPPPPPGAFLRPPRVDFSASAGFSASTGLSAFLAPRVAFSGTGASTFTGLSAFLSFLAADFERDLDLDRLSDLPRPLRRLRVLQLYQQPLLLLRRLRVLRPFRQLYRVLPRNLERNLDLLLDRTFLCLLRPSSSDFWT